MAVAVAGNVALGTGGCNTRGMYRAISIGLLETTRAHTSIRARYIGDTVEHATALGRT